MNFPNRINEKTIEPRDKLNIHSQKQYISLAEQFQNSVNEACE